MGGAPLLSATWFPAEQRTTATAIAAVMNGVGVSVSFIIGELVISINSTTRQWAILGVSKNNHVR